MIKGILAGIVAFVVMWAGWHVGIDHAEFHAMKQYLIQQQRDAAKATP